MQTSKCYLDSAKSEGSKVLHADQKYIDALKTNNYKLIEEIYKLHADMIIRMVTSNNGTEADAKDVMQEAIITLHRYANDEFELTCSLKSFLYTICKRKWINTLKKKERSSKVKITSIGEHELVKEAEADIGHIVDKINREQFCAKIFNMLGPSCKEILKLSWTKNGDGKFHSWIEVAEELDLSYSYVRKKASECKSRLLQLAKKDSSFNFFRSI